MIEFLLTYKYRYVLERNIDTYLNEAIVEEKTEGGWSSDKSLLEFLTDGITDNAFYVRT